MNARAEARPTAPRRLPWLAPRQWPGLWAGAAVAYLALDASTGALLPPVVLLGHFRAFLLLGAAPLGIAMWLLRRRHLGTALLALALAGAWLHRDELVGAGRADPVSAPGQLSVETWNAGLGRAAAEQVVAHLEASPARLVALQEWTPAVRAAVDARLGARFPHRVWRGEGKASMALLSELPLRKVTWIEPPRGKPWLRARVEEDRATLTVIALHVDARAAFLGHWAPARENLEVVLAEVERASPAVLLGDFNLTGAARDLDALRAAGLVNAFEAVGEGFGFTFPVFGRWRGVPSPPVVRIDHVWVTPDLEVLACEVGPDGGSDHLPLRAWLRLP